MSTLKEVQLQVDDALEGDPRSLGWSTGVVRQFCAIMAVMDRESQQLRPELLGIRKEISRLERVLVDPVTGAPLPVARHG